MRLVRLTLAMALGAVAAVAPSALGQTATTYGGMSLDRYDPAARGSDWFELELPRPPRQRPLRRWPHAGLRRSAAGRVQAERQLQQYPRERSALRSRRRQRRPVESGPLRSEPAHRLAAGGHLGNVGGRGLRRAQRSSPGRPAPGRRRAPLWTARRGGDRRHRPLRLPAHRIARRLDRRRLGRDRPALPDGRRG